MNFLQKIFIAYAILEILSILIYLPRMILWFKGFKPQKRLVAKEKRKFGLIIPARNESETIPCLLESIKTLDYPKELFTTHIIVKDPADPTLQLAPTYIDQNLFLYTVPTQKRKADSLDACFKSILEDKDKQCDAYIIVDADCMLTPNFLTEMNNAMESGADVIIGRKRIKNWESNNKKNRNVIANCSAMTYPGVDAMGNKAKAEMGHALNLCGQGMLLTHKFILHAGGYPYKSITEDYEIGANCILDGFKAHYYEYAEIYSEEPTSHKVYNDRRTRWLKGYMDCSRKYGKALREYTFKQGKLKKDALFFIYGVYPLFCMFGASAVAIITFVTSSITLAIMGSSALALKALYYALIVAGIAYFELFFYTCLNLSVDRDINKMTLGEKLKLIFIMPFFLLEYAGIFFKAAFTKEDDWVPIKRIKM